MLRTTTGVPCPTCGATRSLELATHGAWLESLRLHPFGVAFVVVGGAVALWVAAAVLSGRALALPATARRLAGHARWWWLAAIVAAAWTFKLIALGLGWPP